MSRLYSQIQPSVWSGSTGVIIGADLETRVMQFNLLCGEQANSIGLYRLSPLISRAETHLSQEAFDRTMRRLVELRFCEWEPTIERVWVRNMAARQWGETDNPNSLKSIRAAYQSCPECDLKRGFFAMYDGRYNLNGPATIGKHKPKHSVPTPSEHRSHTIGTPSEHHRDGVDTPSIHHPPTVEMVSEHHRDGDSTTMRPETGDRRPETRDQERWRPETTEPAPPSIRLNKEESLAALDEDDNLREIPPLPPCVRLSRRIADAKNQQSFIWEVMAKALHDIYEDVLLKLKEPKIPSAFLSQDETWTGVALHLHDIGRDPMKTVRRVYEAGALNKELFPKWKVGEADPFLVPSMLWGIGDKIPARTAQLLSIIDNMPEVKK